MAEDYIIQCVTDCWDEFPENRPDFATIRGRLKKMKDGKYVDDYVSSIVRNPIFIQIRVSLLFFRQKNIMDQMMDIMEKYANNLEDLVNQRTNEVYEEKRKTEDLLHRMLPAYVRCSYTFWLISSVKTIDFFSIAQKSICFNTGTRIK